MLVLPLLSWAENVSYAYDDLNRLIRAEYENGAVIEYSYDAAGNRLSQVVSGVNQPPTANAGPDQTVFLKTLVTLNGSASSDPDNGPSPLNFRWTQSAGPSVALTGDTTATPSFTPAAVGRYGFDLVVNDGQDSSSPDSVAINVIYNFKGFFPPVDNLPVLNQVKAGQAVPVKFSLSGDQGLNILAAGYPVSQGIACSAGSTDDIEQTVTAGSSSLSYDPSTDQYTYVWKSNKAWAGTCRQLIVKLNDGTEHRASFRFK